MSAHSAQKPADTATTPIWVATLLDTGATCFTATISGLSYSVLRIHEHYHWRHSEAPWSADGYLAHEGAMRAAETDSRRRN